MNDSFSGLERYIGSVGVRKTRRFIPSRVVAIVTGWLLCSISEARKRFGISVGIGRVIMTTTAPLILDQFSCLDSRPLRFLYSYCVSGIGRKMGSFVAFRVYQNVLCVVCQRVAYAGGDEATVVVGYMKQASSFTQIGLMDRN